MRLAAAALVFTGLLSAQSNPTLSVDAAADRRPISPDIYGLNEYGDAGDVNGNIVDVSMLTRYPFTLRRWGGDNSVTYNWKLDSNNSASNWYFENFPLTFLSTHPVDPAKLPARSSFDTWVERSQQFRVRSVATVPIIGWTSKTRTPKVCSYSVRKYGAQEKTDQWAPDCGNGMKPDGRTAIVNDPNDVYEPVGPEFARDWVRHVVSRYGTARQGGVWLWELDNEPNWWHAVHRDIHPELATFDEMLDRGIRWAEAIKQADPTAMVGGPTSAGWESYFYSPKDLMAGWTTGPDWKFWNNPIDRNAHGLDFVPWYLREMRAYEQRTGTRLLDYVDVHGYVNPTGVSWNYDPQNPQYETLRMTSTRMFWDPNYMPNREDMQKMNERYGTGTPQIVPRFRRWVDEYYPGTKIALTEYNWGAMDRITGAIAQADLFGIFGREGLDLATIWDNPKPGSPGEFVWRMFLNYDGAGNGFGETSVRAATSDADQVSIFAAERNDRALTILILNKTEQERAASVALANFRPGGAAQVWSYSQANLTKIDRKGDIAVAEGGLSASVPPLSMTLFVLPAAASGPVPVVRAVVDAASYKETIAPGQMVAIFGENLAPETPVYYPRLENPDLVANSLNGIRVLFNGVPAAVIATTPGQVNAVVPYVAGTSGTASIQVERDGHRSAPITATLAAAAPSIFTASQTGRGQGAILNNLGNNVTQPNSAQAPAAPGSIISVFLTGEGLTDPPSIDGRLATTILPKPVLPVTAEVGGRSAVVHYAGAAPGNMAGLMQVNVEVPRDVPAGDLPITIKVGPHASQEGVTVAVR